MPILGTSPDAIDLAEDRDRFGALLAELDIPAPVNGSAYTTEEAVAIAARIGYPVVVRPSYVLGGRAMAIVDDETALRRYMREAVDVTDDRPDSDRPVSGRCLSKWTWTRSATASGS